MIEIKNVEVYGLDSSIIKSGYPMQTGEPSYDIYHIENKDIKRAKHLASCKSGAGHDCSLKGVIVNFDLKYSLYFTKQLQRYHFIDFVSSQSTMHCITKMNIEESCNKYVDGVVIQNLQFWVKQYNNFDKEIGRLKALASNSGGYLFEEVFNMYPQDKVCIEDDKGNKEWYSKYDIFMKIISNTPAGFEYWAAMTTNYLQLKTIYHQRKNHKLKEDWGYFCEWIESLPMFKELVLGE